VPKQRSALPHRNRHGTEGRARGLPTDAHGLPMTAPTPRCIQFVDVRKGDFRKWPQSARMDPAPSLCSDGPQSAPLLSADPGPQCERPWHAKRSAGRRGGLRPAPRLGRRNLFTCTQSDRLSASTSTGARRAGSLAPAVVRARYPENARASDDHQSLRFSGTPPLRSLICRRSSFAQACSAVGGAHENRPSGAPTPQGPDHRGQTGRIGGWKPRLGRSSCPPPQAIVLRRVA
jgi:hypothetical protein